MFTCGASDGYKEVLDKIKMKTLVYGDKTLMVEFRLAVGPICRPTSIPTSRPAIWSPAASISRLAAWCMPFARGTAGASPVMSRIRPWRMPIRWPWKSLALSARIICPDREEDAK
jgi:hypothetical protein